MTKVFLGGTCNGSLWRKDLIRMLEGSDVEYFDPVVDDWDDEAQAREEEEKRTSDYHLYCITPLKRGDYAIAEVIDSAHRNPSGTIFCYLNRDFSRGTDAYFLPDQAKSLEAVGRLVARIGSFWAPDLESVSEILRQGLKMEKSCSMIEVEVGGCGR